MTRRRLLVAAVLLLTAVSLPVAWHLCGWPPPRLILTYGFPPAGGPTGRTKVIEGIEFVEISPGYLRMGSHFNCLRGDFLGRTGSLIGLSVGDPPRHGGVSCPPRWVEVERPIWVATTEVTCDQYHRFATDWDDYDYGDRPVTNVTLDQAKWFCQWLGRDADVEVRLPTPEEWEYAATAGTRSGLPGSGDPTEVPEYAWCRENVTDGMEQPVGTLRPNRFGLYDTHGNLMEWCSDGTYRGGCWLLAADEIGSDLGGGTGGARPGSFQMNHIGFRPVFSLPEDE